MQNIKVAVDAVVFGYDKESGLNLLLIKRNIEPYKNAWALPGGLVKDSESLDEAVARELKEEAGLQTRYLEQLYTFGEPKRDPRNRVVSVAYFGVVRQSSFKLHASTDAADAAWFSLESLPDLAFDHTEIIKTARQRLKAKLTYQPVGFDLLDEKFLFSDLEHLYTSVLERPIDRRNFKKKIMQFGFLEQLAEKRKADGAGRPGNLYKFRTDIYNQLSNSGFIFDI